MKANEDVCGEESRHGVPTWGIMAAFLAGIGLAAGIAAVHHANSGRTSKRAENVLDACDRALQTLEQRLSAVDMALAG